MNKLLDIINSMTYEELKQIQKDMYEGNLSGLIRQKIEVIEQKDTQQVCPVCGSQLASGKAQYTLSFGTSVKRQASFCEIDCLEFFIRELKESKRW